MNKKTLPKDGFIARRLKAYDIFLPNNLCPLTRAFIWAMVLTVLWPLWFPGYYLMKLFKFNTSTDPKNFAQDLKWRYDFSIKDTAGDMKKEWNKRIKVSKEFDAADRVMGFLCGLVLTSSLVILCFFLFYNSINEHLVHYSIIILAFWAIGLIIGLHLASRNYAIYKRSNTPKDYVDKILNKKKSKISQKISQPFIGEIGSVIKQRYKDFKEKTCTPIYWN